jgi:hypothetical protein
MVGGGGRQLRVPATPHLLWGPAFYALRKGGGSIPVCPYDILVSLALVPRLSDLLFVLCACLRLPWGVCLPDS